MVRDEYSQQKNIMGQQELKQVLQGQFWNIMYMSIGALTFDIIGGGMGTGTAFAISSNLIFTAAHNLLDKSYNPPKKSANLKFFLGANGQVNTRKDFYKIQQGNWRYLNNFQTIPSFSNMQKSSNKIKDDYAILKLAEKIQRPLNCYQIIGGSNFMSLFISCQECCPDAQKNYSPLSIYGYPLVHDNFRKIGQSRMKMKQYGLTSKKKVLEVQPNRGKIKYMISTLIGQSGSPVVSDKGVVAIHAGAANMSLQAIFVRILAAKSQIQLSPKSIIQLKAFIIFQQFIR